MSKNFIPRKCWIKADWKEIEDYKNNLEHNLYPMIVPHVLITYVTMLSTKNVFKYFMMN